MRRDEHDGQTTARRLHPLVQLEAADPRQRNVENRTMRVDLLREIFLGGREHRDAVTMRAKQDGQPPTNVRVVIDDDQIQDDLRDAIVSIRPTVLRLPSIFVE